jgi:hypothetical protein
LADHSVQPRFKAGYPILDIYILDGVELASNMRRGHMAVLSDPTGALSRIVFVQAVHREPPRLTNSDDESKQPELIADSSVRAMFSLFPGKGNEYK